MHGPLRLRTEILRSIHDSEPEQTFPGPVDPNPRGQGVFTRDQPAGQPQAVERLALRQRGQDRGQSPAHLLGRLVVFPAVKNEGILGLSLFLHHHGTREGTLESIQSLLGLGYLRLGLGRGVGSGRFEMLFQLRPFSRLQVIVSLGQKRGYFGRMTRLALQGSPLVRRMGETEASHVVLVEGFVKEPDHEFTILRYLDRRIRKEHGLDRFATGRSIHSPTIFTVPVVDEADVPPLLGIVRHPTGQLDRHGLAFAWANFRFHAREHEVSVAVAAEALVGNPGVRKAFQ